MERDAGSKDEDSNSMPHNLKLALKDYRVRRLDLLKLALAHPADSRHSCSQLYMLAIIIITKTTAGAVTQVRHSRLPAPPRPARTLSFSGLLEVFTS